MTEFTLDQRICLTEGCSNSIEHTHGKTKFCRFCKIARRKERQNEYNSLRKVENPERYGEPSIEEDKAANDYFRAHRVIKKPVPAYLRDYLDQIDSGERPSQLKHTDP